MSGTITDSAPQAPYTPTKSNVNVSSTEVAPDYSPAPEYNAKPQEKTESQVSVYGPSEIAKLTETILSKMPPVSEHPILPVGNVLSDVRTHLNCHQNLNTNIETLLSQYKTMRKDLDQARVELGQAQHDLRIEQAEREAAQREIKRLEEVLAELVDDLNRARDQLAQTEARLSLAVSQLADTVRKLELARSELRTRTRERDEFERRLQDALRLVDWYKLRSNELQTALDSAIEGENAANDRNTQLTAMLYIIERSKAEIERAKDRAEAEVRNLKKELREGGTSRKIVEELESRVWLLNEQIASLTVDKETLNAKIADQSRTIDNLKTESRYHKDMSQIWQKQVADYQKAVSKISPKKEHRNCRELFTKLNPPVRIMSSSGAADGEIAPEPVFHKQEATDVAVPEQVVAKEEAKEEPVAAPEESVKAKEPEVNGSTETPAASDPFTTGN